jgi:hypothetical protein
MCSCCVQDFVLQRTMDANGQVKLNYAAGFLTTETAHRKYLWG